MDPPTVEEFADDLAAAITTGDDEYLNARLHPEVIARFGEAVCSQHIAADVSGEETTWDIRGSSGPQEWDYATDGLSTIIPDAWFVDVLLPDSTPAELHFAPAEGTWRWFTDCGEPA